MLGFAPSREFQCLITPRTYTGICFIYRMIASTFIECVSGALANGLQAELIGSVQVTIDNAIITAEGVSFEYKQDPVFVSMSPRMTIPS